MSSVNAWESDPPCTTCRSHLLDVKHGIFWRWAMGDGWFAYPRPISSTSQGVVTHAHVAFLTCVCSPLFSLLFVQLVGGDSLDTSNRLLFLQRLGSQKRRKEKKGARRSIFCFRHQFVHPLHKCSRTALRSGTQVRHQMHTDSFRICVHGTRDSYGRKFGLCLLRGKKLFHLLPNRTLSD